MYRNVEIILYDLKSLYEKLELIKDEKIDYAFAFHDKDDVKPHYHLRLFAQDKRSLSSWSKLLLVDKNSIEFLQFKKLSIRYLIHLDNPEKYQYNEDIIVSNFDVKPYLKKKNDEQEDVILIIEFILNQPYYLYLKTLYNYVIINNLWSTYRRNYTIIKEILYEHNKHFSC